MFREISIKNFKCFKENHFEFSNINLLTGANGRGKSTLLQTLLLLRQSLAHNENIAQLILNGQDLSLGSFLDIQNRDTRRGTPIILDYLLQGLDQESDLSLGLRYEFGEMENTEDQNALDIKEVHIESSWPIMNMKDKKTTHNIKIKKDPQRANGYEEDWGEEIPSFNAASNVLNRFAFLPLKDPKHPERNPSSIWVGKLNIAHFSKIHYIAADRLGPQNYYVKSQLSPTFLTVDRLGKNMASILLSSINQQATAHPKLIFDASSFPCKAETETIQSQLGNWIGYITDNPKVSIEIDREGTNDYIVTLIFEFNGQKFKPANVGFGYSYILSIVLTGLIAKSGETIIIENPEAHLHPKAQSRLTEFLAKVSNTGVQIFIETHSDHVLNALRLHTKRQTIKPQDSKVFFFSKDGVYTPEIDENGRINVWPEDFFDELENNLMELI